MKFHENKPVRLKFFLPDRQTDKTRPLIVFVDYRRSTVGVAVFVTNVTSHISVHSFCIGTAQYIQVCVFKFSPNY